MMKSNSKTTTKMKTLGTLIPAVVMLLVLAAGATAVIEPSSFTSSTYKGNFTDGGGSPTTHNDSRGYIHVLNINESQQTPRWKAYVGNITGELSLGDGTDSLFDWPVDTVTGELYATRYDGSGTGTLDQGSSGTPLWSNIECANNSILSNETTKLNHDPTSDVDALNETFVAEGDLASVLGTGGTFTDFTVADNNIDTTSCLGTFLNVNDNDQVSDWQQVVLSDTGDSKPDDLMYAASLYDDTTGFNGETYDYQMLLPEDGAEGTVANNAYYFYIELVGQAI